MKTYMCVYSLFIGPTMHVHSYIYINLFNLSCFIKTHLLFIIVKYSQPLAPLFKKVSVLKIPFHEVLQAF